ncbi:sterol carrier family protein [Streptomyces sp. RFCAC02]|uniref:sterol carrier family protein n=1 Tax=Streptomyces sp. RFCAC02 TaxID=2499143 RepID=UPI00101ECC0F|nr:sterol carrier family protein [Streptomyces sp. RFCAC02]
MSGAVRRKPRAYHPDRVRDAVLAQVEAVRLAAHELTPEQRAKAPRLPELLGHLARQIDALPRLLAEPAPRAMRPQLDITGWVLATVHEERDAAPVDAIDAAAEEVEAVLETGVREDLLVPHHLGAMRAVDLTVTRVVELVLHSDDLTRATGHHVQLDRTALAITTRVLADALAAKAPGSSTELRVPPFAAVQCVEGPRHTRGTPPNVVEADPLTFLRLATGRTAWDAAVTAGRLRASGERSRALAAELPVLG